MTEPAISVCILAGHGSPQLRACLTSLQAQTSPPTFELLVGGKLAPELLDVVLEHFPEALVCGTGQWLPGAARNPLIARASGELLLFLDDDVIAPENLLRDLAHTAAGQPESSVFGGPNETPNESSRFQIVQGAVLSSLMGSGPVSRRYGARHACYADERWFTLCNLAVRRNVMAPFLDDLVCAEENALLAELRNRGEQMRYDPRLRVFHERRPTWRAFARQMHKYGRGRGELIKRSPADARLAFVAPAALVLYASFVLIMTALGMGQAIWLAPGAIYVLLIGASGLQIAKTLSDARCAFLAAALTVTTHFCYGAGLLRGVIRPGLAVGEGAARWVKGLAPEPESASQPSHRVPAGSSPLNQDRICL